MLSSIFLTGVLAATASAECTRAMLQDATSKYLLAQSSGSISSLSTTISNNNLNYTENWKPANISTGILATPLKIDHNRSIHDTTLCATFTELIIAKSEHPYVIGTRMLFNNSKITTMESLVTKPGDWAFNATGYLYWDSLEKWDPISVEKRDTRAVIQAAGDAYFDRFDNVSLVVPWGTPCARLEGGAYTGRQNMTGNTCDLGLPSKIVVTNRRYVIDEEMGVVDMYLGFPGLDRSHVNEAMPDSHMFRVEGGKIRYIHTLSTCINSGCGLNTTFPGRI